MSDLTERQAEALAFIERHIAEHHYPPSVREIGAAVGQRSPSTTHALLAALEHKGAIARETTRSRSIVVVGAKSCAACGRAFEVAS